jgi:hypothetical protein
MEVPSARRRSGARRALSALDRQDVTDRRGKATLRLAHHPGAHVNIISAKLAQTASCLAACDDQIWPVTPVTFRT